MWQSHLAGRARWTRSRSAHVTNGVHFRSWISAEMDQLYDRYLGPRWREEPARRDAVEADRAHSGRGAVAHARAAPRAAGGLRAAPAARSSCGTRGAPQAEIEAADEVLDPEALTIGFARRFATYKRATLLLRDPRAAGAHPQQPGAARCRSSSPARRIRATTPARS